ncbi:MAG: carbohydrate ABC transporter permease [Thermomicrobiales bacterium]
MATTGATIREAGREGLLTSRTRDRLRRNLAAYLFLVPTFVFIGYFLYYPAYRALVGGFTFWDGFNAPQYIGLENFRRAFADPILRIATKNNLIWAAIDVALSITPAFLVASLIFHVRRDAHRYLYRTLFVVPIIIPGIVTILLWRYYYQGEGLINNLLTRVGLGDFTHLWLADPKTALYALALMGFPWINAFNMLIFFAGLQNIPVEVLEAAELDGASGLKRVWTIEIPMILSQFKLLFILAVITSGQNIVTPLVMTNGGPGYSTYTVSLYMYDTAVRYGEFGYSMAIALMLFLFILLLTAINQRFIKG